MEKEFLSVNSVLIESSAGFTFIRMYMLSNDTQKHINPDSSDEVRKPLGFKSSENRFSVRKRYIGSAALFPAT